MLEVQFQKVFDNALAFRVLEQGSEWYRIGPGHPGLHVASLLRPDIFPDSISLRGAQRECDGRMGVCVTTDPEELIRKHIENLRNAARLIYGSETMELKPGVYTDDVLVEVTNNKDGDWVQRYLLSIDTDMCAKVWLYGKTGSQCGYKDLNGYDYVRPIPRDNFSFFVYDNRGTTTVTIMGKGENRC